MKIQTTTEKNWVDLISRPNKLEKKLQLQKIYILRKRAKKLKKLHLNLLTTFHKTFAYHDSLLQKKPINLWLIYFEKETG